MRQNAVIDWSNYRMLLFIFLYAYAAYKVLQQNATSFYQDAYAAYLMFCNKNATILYLYALLQRQQIYSATTCTKKKCHFLQHTSVAEYKIFVQ